jgi:hypothetical protein
MATFLFGKAEGIVAESQPLHASTSLKRLADLTAGHGKSETSNPFLGDSLPGRVPPAVGCRYTIEQGMPAGIY